MKRIIIILSAVGLLAVAAVGAMAFYQLKQKPWVTHDTWLYVYADESAESLQEKLLEASGESKTSVWYRLSARITKLEQKRSAGLLTGAYKLREGMTMLQAMRVVALNMQTPVKVTFIGMRSVPEVAGRMAQNIMADSAQIVSAIYSPEFMAACQTDSANVGSFLLPDTYEVYWDIAPEKLMQRLLSEYRKFWNEARTQKATDLGVTPREVSILCSIAEEETADRTERGVVARLYWNRLKRGMLLQADPTVKFAVGDFTLRRILNKHLEVQSPYNTYKVAGLPPGPIRVVEKRTIDALLNSKPHPYLYMCAKEDFSGLHNFATTLSEHNRNAAKYHNALQKRGIK